MTLTIVGVKHFLSFHFKNSKFTLLLITDHPTFTIYLCYSPFTLHNLSPPSTVQSSAPGIQYYYLLSAISSSTLTITLTASSISLPVTIILSISSIIALSIFPAVALSQSRLFPLGINRTPFLFSG